MQWPFSGICLVFLLVSQAVLGQDREPVPQADEEETATVEAAAGEAEPEPIADLDELEPGVPSQVLAADVTRVRSSSGVMDELDLGATEITGNQELPKVLYIVPWRESDPGDLMGRPANTLLDDVLAPVDRREFTREVDYYSDLFGKGEEQ